MEERGTRRPPTPRERPTQIAAGVSPQGEVKPVVVPEAEARTEENAAPSKGLPPQAPVSVVPSYSRVHRVVSGVDVDVPVTSLWPARLIITRTPSGTRYEWPQAGAILLVKAEDIPYLLTKNDRSPRPCCGQSGGRNYFQFPPD